MSNGQELRIQDLRIQVSFLTLGHSKKTRETLKFVWILIGECS